MANRSENPNVEKKDILGVLLSSRRSTEKEKQLSDEEIVADIYMFLVAGHETTARALTFTLHLLATHPDIQEELHKRIVDTIGDAEPTHNDLPKLDFPFNVFKETLRLFPAVTVIPKTNTETTKLGNFEIPARTLLDINVLRIHRHPSYWREPEKFWPQRWYDTTQLGVTLPHCFLPFSHGKRGCIGRRFSEIEATLFLTMFSQRYRVAYAPGAVPITLNDTIQLITLNPTKPITLVVTKR